MRVIVGWILLALIAFGAYSGYGIITQEENSYEVLMGAMRLVLSAHDIAEIEHEDIEEYITYAKDETGPIFDFYAEKGYSLKEQMGSGYLMESENGEIIITVRKYTRYMNIWKVSEKNDN